MRALLLVVLLVVLLVGGAVAALWLLLSTGGTPPVSPTSPTPPPPAAESGRAPATATGVTSTESRAARSETKREAVTIETELPRLHGRVTRAGRPVAGRRVECKSLANFGAELDTVTAADGSYSFHLPAGKYEVEMPMREGRQVARPRWGRGYRGPPTELPVRAAWRLVDLDEDTRCDIELATGAIVVRAIDAVTFQLIPDVVVTWYAPPPMLQNLEITCETGTTRIDDVPDGPQTIGLSRRGYSSAMSDRFDVQQDTHTIELHMQPVGAFDVVLVDARGEPTALTHEHQIEVRNVDTDRPAEAANRDAIRDRRRPHAIDRFRYDDLEPGRYRISGMPDRQPIHGDSIRFAPFVFDPTAPDPFTVDVPGGTVTEVRIPVRVRSAVELQPIDRWGNLTEARLFIERLDAGTGPTRVSPYPSSVTGYRGYLAPGSYSVRVERDGKIRVERLVVGDDGAPIERGLRIE